MTIGRALISVYDKTGIEELAATLHAAGSRSFPPDRPRRPSPQPGYR